MGRPVTRAIGLKVEGTNAVKKNVFAVDYPGYVQNVNRMLESLGGEEQILAARMGRLPLHLRHRPRDPLSHPVTGALRWTPTKLLLRLTRTRRVKKVKKSRRGQEQSEATTASPLSPPCGELGETHFRAEVVARLTETYTFDKLADYQYTCQGDVGPHPARPSQHPEPVFGGQAPSEEAIKPWEVEDAPLLVLPKAFSASEQPYHGYMFSDKRTKLYPTSAGPDTEDSRPSSLGEPPCPAVSAKVSATLQRWFLAVGDGPAGAEAGAAQGPGSFWERTLAPLAPRVEPQAQAERRGEVQAEAGEQAEPAGAPAVVADPADDLALEQELDAIMGTAGPLEFFPAPLTAPGGMPAALPGLVAGPILGGVTTGADLGMTPAAMAGAATADMLGTVPGVATYPAPAAQSPGPRSQDRDLAGSDKAESTFEIARRGLRDVTVSEGIWTGNMNEDAQRDIPQEEVVNFCSGGVDQPGASSGSGWDTQTGGGVERAGLEMEEQGEACGDGRGGVAGWEQAELEGPPRPAILETEPDQTAVVRHQEGDARNAAPLGGASSAVAAASQQVEATWDDHPMPLAPVNDQRGAEGGLSDALTRSGAPIVDDDVNGDGVTGQAHRVDLGERQIGAGNVQSATAQALLIREQAMRLAGQGLKVAAGSDYSDSEYEILTAEESD